MTFIVDLIPKEIKKLKAQLEQERRKVRREMAMSRLLFKKIKVETPKGSKFQID